MCAATCHRRLQLYNTFLNVARVQDLHLLKSWGVIKTLIAAASGTPVGGNGAVLGKLDGWLVDWRHSVRSALASFSPTVTSLHVVGWVAVHARVSVPA